MWLLNTTTLELREFIGAVPRYAILSHTWGQDEVSFKDMRKNQQRIKGESGFIKIRQCCLQASKENFDWVWVDSCCIDKRSSAELSEAINGMFKWSDGAEVCYAYLEDVPPQAGQMPLETLSKSRWFSRGWTLQELLAPSNIEFFAKDWSLLGKKSQLDRYFVSLISAITGIGQEFLLSKARLQEVSIATRMSWAAQRETTRPEDRAYSLMGIFEINMPILYGEGLKGAFERLQVEIVKKSSDQSIFAWRLDEAPSSGPYGLLAPSPSYFKNSQFSVKALRVRLRPFYITNIGIQITLRLNLHSTLLLNPSGSEETGDRSDAVWAASLRCWTYTGGPQGPDYRRIQIYLRERQTAISSGFRVFQRVLPHQLGVQDDRIVSELVEICVPSPDQIMHLEQSGGILRVPTHELAFEGYE